MEQPKKPKGVQYQSKRFPGMLPKPKVHNPIVRKKKTSRIYTKTLIYRKYKVLPYIVDKRFNEMSHIQARDQVEFMKVRDGETKEKWMLRTRYRRVPKEEEKTTFKKRNIKFALVDVAQTKKKKAAVYRVVNVWFRSRHFSFMKNYLPVITWASIKYNIHQSDFEIAFLLYNDNRPFSREQFMRRVYMCYEEPNRIFAHFIKMGYLHQIDTRKDKTKGEPRNCDLFYLSNNLMQIIGIVYDKMMGLVGFDLKKEKRYLNSNNKEMDDAIYNELNRMNNECLEIIQELKEPDYFKRPGRKKQSEN